MTYIRRWLVFLLVFDVFPSPLIRPPFLILNYLDIFSHGTPVWPWPVIDFCAPLFSPASMPSSELYTSRSGRSINE